MKCREEQEAFAKEAMDSAYDIGHERTETYKIPGKTKCAAVKCYWNEIEKALVDELPEVANFSQAMQNFRLGIGNEINFEEMTKENGETKPTCEDIKLDFGYDEGVVDFILQTFRINHHDDYYRRPTWRFCHWEGWKLFGKEVPKPEYEEEPYCDRTKLAYINEVCGRFWWDGGWVKYPECCPGLACYNGLAGGKPTCHSF